DIAIIAALQFARPALAPMIDFYGLDFEFALLVLESRAFAPGKFGSAFQGCSGKHVSSDLGGDTENPGRKMPQRGQIHVVHVSMRKQNHINGRKFLKGQGRGDVPLWAGGAETERYSDAIAKGGIRENPNAVEVDQHTGMTEPTQCNRVIGPLKGS